MLGSHHLVLWILHEFCYPKFIHDQYMFDGWLPYGADLGDYNRIEMAFKFLMKNQMPIHSGLKLLLGLLVLLGENVSRCE